MPGKHAQFSPSGSPYWYNDGDGCVARVMLPAKPETSSPAAERGTFLHDVAETLLRGDLLSEAVTQEDIEEVSEYVNYVQELQFRPEVNVTIEEDVLLAPITGEPGATGAVDALVCSDEYLEVIDLKTGRKIVEPTSSQLRMYAAAAVYELNYEGKEVKCTIHQGGKAYSVVYATEDLLAFAQQVRRYVDTALQVYQATGMPAYNPSEDNCQWCPHVLDCEAVNSFKDAVAANDFAVEGDPDLLASDLGMVGALRKWCDNVEAAALEMASNGITLNGYKLVHARTNRKWAAEAEQKLVALLGDAAYDRKLIGLTAADKLVDADTMNDLTTKPEGKPVLAPLKDKRPAIDDAATDFKNA